MMIEHGRIRSVSGTSVTIQQELGGSCFGCMNAE